MFAGGGGGLCVGLDPPPLPRGPATHTNAEQGGPSNLGASGARITLLSLCGPGHKIVSPTSPNPPPPHWYKGSVPPDLCTFKRPAQRNNAPKLENILPPPPLGRATPHHRRVWGGCPPPPQPLDRPT